MKKSILAGLVASLIWSCYAFAQVSSPPHTMPRGTAAKPGFYVLGDRDTGLYSAGANQLGVTLGGVAVGAWSSAGSGVPAGTAAAPGLYFIGDTNTGLYSPGADTLGLALGGVSVFDADAGGSATFYHAYLGTVSSGNGAAALYAKNDTAGSDAYSTLYLEENGAGANFGGLTKTNTGYSAGTTIYEPLRLVLHANAGLTAGLALNTEAAAPILFVTGGAEASSEKARFASDGSFLIGTTTDDTELLKVAGTAEITGLLTLGGGLTAGGTTVNITSTNLQRNGNAVGLSRTFTATYDPASIAAGSSLCENVTVTGITTTGGAVSANIGAVDPAAGCVVATVRASATNTVRVCWRNAIDAVTACDTASSTWTFSQAQ